MRQRFNLVFWLGILAFVMVSSLSAWRLLQLHNEIHLRDQTSAIEQKLTELYNTLLEADVTFLVLRNSQAIPDAKKLLRLIKMARLQVDSLSVMVTPKSPIHHEVIDLHDMVSEKLSLSEKIMLNMDLESGPPLQRVLVIQNDLLLTEKVNRKIHSIEAYLVTNLNEHRASVDRYFDVNLLSIGATATVAFALMLTFAGLVWSEIRRRRLLEVDLRQAQQAAIHASELKSQFLATVSHEVRTPLNGIIGMSELLQHRLQGELAQFASVIQASGKTLLRIVNDLLDFSKIEANKLNVEIQEVRPSQILEAAVDLFSPRAAQKKLRVYCSYPREFDDIFAADGVRISQVIHNFISNAVKFTIRGFVEIRGSLGETTDDQLTLRFEVSDSGPGIDPSQAQFIFQPFFQVKPEFQSEGTGLGLAISKRLVDLMGGRIGMHTRSGGGSVFWFELPLRRLKRDSSPVPQVFKGKRISAVGLLPQDQDFVSKMSSAYGGQMTDGDGDLVFTYRDQIVTGAREVWTIGFESELSNETKHAVIYPMSPMRFLKALDVSSTSVIVKSQPAAAASAATVGAATVLLVEDNPTNQLLAQAQLEQLGYRVRLAQSGAECLEALREAPFGVVLMDCRMPGMDGFEVTRRIRERERAERLPRMPIIAMTAHALADDKRKCLAAGMDDHIAKPIEIHQLHRLIQKWAPDFSVAIDPTVVQDLEKKTSKQVIERLFRSFHDTLSQGVEQIKTFEQARDWQGLGSLCHQLRSAAAAVGALVLSRAFERIENTVEQKMEPSAAEIEDLLRLSRNVVDELAHRLS